MLGESTDFTSQTVAMGYLGTAYGFGAILGPVIDLASQKASVPRSDSHPRWTSRDGVAEDASKTTECHDQALLRKKEVPEKGR